MTIGMMITFFDFRNDIRELIKSLCKHNKVVLFIKKEHEELIKPHLIPGLTYRLISEQKKTWKNYIADRLFLLLNKIPKSKQNYYLMEEFKLNNLQNPGQQNKAKFILKLKKFLPKVISYDFYLSKLTYKGETDISGIDKFIAFTEIYDDYLFARLLTENLPIAVYVYSWDHPCKHVRFSKKVNYLVWNKGMSEDLQQLQGINENAITELGATQLGYIYKFRQSVKAKPALSYFYYGCGIGIENLVPVEIAIIETLADAILETNPDYKLIVRPYPNFKNWALYNQLLKKENIELDNSYKQNDLSISEEDIINKFQSINNAQAFFHIGTTLGLEACFTECPSFILDLLPKQDNKKDIYHFIHQYQNEKYLMNGIDSNTITSLTNLKNTFKELPHKNFLSFNQAVAQQFTVLSFDEIANQLIDK